MAQEADALAASVARFRTSSAAAPSPAAPKATATIRTRQPIAQMRLAGGAVRKPTLVAPSDGWEEF